MQKFAFTVIAAIVSAPASAAPTQPFDFLTEYLRATSSIESMRAAAQKNQSATPSDMAGCVHDTEAWRLETSSAARMLGNDQLPAGNMASETPKLLASTLETKAGLIGELRDICAAFMTGPKPGVDYDALATKAPVVRARLEAADKSLFAGAVLAFSTLLSPTPDKAGHISYLSITKSQRDTLLAQIDADFAPSKVPADGYLAQTAALFRSKLLEYHMADER